MDVSEAILKRRSVRKFSSAPIDKELIIKILEAGRWAPSEGNLQAWHVYVVQNEELKEKFVPASLGQTFIREAPVVFVLCVDLNRTAPYGTRGRDLFCLQTSGAVVQNMMLQAFSLGLGSCWVGAFKEEAIKEILNIPNHLRPVALIPVGYSLEERNSKRRELEEFTTWL